jgi:tetratricopeptide (TPR) repeat protein
MSVDLYERYKDALRRGHMAMARSQLDVALAAYREALALAPERPLPHVGAGQALLRKGDAQEALAAFDAALDRSPRDEAGLRGRADALAGLGRRSDAAHSLDVLSDVQERAGRIGDAYDTTRHALELAEQKARRRRLQDLARRVRIAAGARPDDQSLATTLRALDASEAATEAFADSAAARSAYGVPSLTAPGDANDADAPPTGRQPAMAPPPDPVALIVEGEVALDAGDLAAARVAYLAAAAAFAADGLTAAALDACWVALAFAPDDAELHLRLVELYLEAGWDGPAADKLALLARLTELDGKQAHTRARIVGLAADHFPDDPRLHRLSAQGGLRP